MYTENIKIHDEYNGPTKPPSKKGRPSENKTSKSFTQFDTKRPSKDQKITIVQNVINFIKANPGMSASNQKINRELGLGLSHSRMHSIVYSIKMEGKIYEAKGRYYFWKDLPKELEKFI